MVTRTRYAAGAWGRSGCNIFILRHEEDDRVEEEAQDDRDEEQLVDDAVARDLRSLGTLPSLTAGDHGVCRS